MARKPRKEKLNILLLKEGTEVGSAIRPEVSNLRTFPISREFAFAGEIKTRRSDANPPRWRSLVQSGTTDRIDDLLNQNCGAVIILTVADRVFCIAFGSAYHWVDDQRIERRFGMMVTLNAVHHQKIRSVDREEFDVVNRMTRSQTSVSSGIENFGMDVQRDLVRSVAGRPEDETFATYVSGADSLALTVAVSFSELGEKCQRALEISRQTRYRERYAWIDNFLRVRDKNLIAQLEDDLLAAVRAASAESTNVYLSPPALMDTQEHRGFRYPGERGTSEAHEELRLHDFLQGHGQRPITLESLKNQKIREYRTDSTDATGMFTVFDAIVYEVRKVTKLYVLTRGEWFEIDEDYVREVNQEIEGVPDAISLQLPEATPSEIEKEYNQRVVDASAGEFALLDRKTVPYGGGRSGIELCDLISIDRNFIHVKVSTKSSTLSHLFNQGLNSAQAFRDLRFRRSAAERCPESHRHLVDIAADGLRTTDYSVTFAIITRAPVSIKESLPFFSKQSLANAAREIRNMGYKVYIKKITVTEPAPQGAVSATIAQRNAVA